MNTYVSVKVDSTTYKHFKIPTEVYVYIRQLEMYINNPRESRLKERYPERFSKYDWGWEDPRKMSKERLEEYYYTHIKHNGDLIP